MPPEAPTESPVALVFPPLWDTLDAPPLGPAVLAGSLRDAGVPVRVFDLNLAFHDWLLSDATVRELLRLSQGSEESEELEQLARLPELPAAERTAAPGRLSSLFFLATSLGMEGRPLLGPQRFLVGAASSRVRLAHLVDPPDDDPVPALWARLMKDWAAELAATTPRLVAMSILHVAQLLPAITLARTLRDVLPRSVPILAGGPWCTFAAVSGVDPTPLWSVFDGIGLGPGEEVLVAAAAHADGLPEMAGLWRAENPERPKLGRPAPASPDFSALPLSRYFATADPPIFPLESSRGCWASCRYCNYRALQRGYRTKPIDQVLAEVDDVHARVPGAHITLVDDTIAPKRALALAKAIGERAAGTGRDIVWGGCLRPDAGLDPEQCRALHAGGVRRVFIGFDAATEGLLSEIDKRATLDDIRVLVGNLRDAGIVVAGNFIVGLPGETEADRRKILAFIEELSLDSANVTTSLFAVGRGSWYFEHMEQVGWPQTWIDRVRANDVLTDFMPAPPIRRPVPGTSSGAD